MKKSRIGSTIENFKGPQPDGSEIELYNHLGKITLIDFWAGWCKPCRLENPNIVSVYQDYRNKTAKHDTEETKRQKVIIKLIASCHIVIAAP